MPVDRGTPQSANDFIEQQLHARLESLESCLDGDALSFSGRLYFGADDVLRKVIEDLKSVSDRKRLVVVLTTSGGFIEVVNRMVTTIRHHYEYVDFIVPDHAFSAGTVFAMSGDAIYMNYYSQLGPIDPQVQGSNGRTVPALGYLVQYERLLKQAEKGKLTTILAKIILDFDQAELYQYEQARELSIKLLKDWLTRYKFKNWSKTESRGLPVTSSMKTRRAQNIASQLNDTDRWHSHGYGISMDVLRKDLKLKIDDFDSDPKLSACVRDYHNLLDDYMARRGVEDVVHSRRLFVPLSV